MSRDGRQDLESAKATRWRSWSVLLSAMKKRVRKA
jgi:hypothetical protein